VSSLINPVGPEEPSTYWRRRAIAVVALLVVLWLFWLILSSAFGGSGNEPAADGPSPTPGFGLSMSPEPDESASAGASPAASGAQEESASPSPSASASCADVDIVVAVETSSGSASQGAGMGLTMTVTNNGDEACNRDVGAGANEVQVSSGSVLVWSSDYCNPSEAQDMQVLEPGTPWTTSVTWPGTITAEGCPTDQPTAKAGSYRAVARNGSVESEPVTFEVK